ncbi:legumin A-like isoform 1 [Hibiscus syriacus]|uniref:Legumin A-like isoform 1 n=1 Tax=Hibiscus syriacus TaxID=106335 RepID=A0A6A2YPH2_HIBSY|nr:legumin A-like isoform 1 [Hibiscus syriacus]
MKMPTSLVLSRLIIFFLFLSDFAAVSSATTTTTTLKRHFGFWSSMREAWPRMVPQGLTVWKMFGSRATERYRSDMKLLEWRAVDEEGDVFSELVKQASAALLNSYARKGLPYTAWEVKTLMIQGLVSKGAAARLTKRFSVANDACI